MGKRHDSYLGYTGNMAGLKNPDPLQFYQSSKILKWDGFDSEIPGKLLEYRFLQNVIYTEYTRTKYNVFIVLAELGGIFNSLYLIGYAFTKSFSYNLMMSSLIRKLYLFNAKFPSEKKKQKSKDNGKDGDKKLKDVTKRQSSIASVDPN